MTRILVATDIHMPSPYLATILEGIKQVKPDALIISGDLCSCPDWHNDCIYTKLESRSFAKINKEKMERNIRGRQTIIVTHHAPFKELIKEYSFFNAYDGQDLSNIIFNSNKKIVYYIYGHLHENSAAPKMTINGITFINTYTFQFKLKDYIQNALLNL